eukprot:EG_transcript_1983
MAAWGITYGTSYSRVSTMARQFSDLSTDAIAQVSMFILDILHGNANLVGTILTEQWDSGSTRSVETQAQMAQTISVLVNYTANSTAQSRRQMDAVVDAFGRLMHGVVADFKGLAGGYAAQVRADVAAKGMTTVAGTSNAITVAMQRLQKLVDVGLLDLSQSPTDPIGEADCTLLSLLCATADEFSSLPLILATAAGRSYRCGSLEGGTVSTVTYQGGRYNESYLSWRPYADTVPAVSRQEMKQRCLTENATVQVVGANCPQPRNCQCGADPRCEPWYAPYANGSTQYRATILPDAAGVLRMHATLPLLNASAAPPALLGVVDLSSPTSQMDSLLTALAGPAAATTLAVVINDTALPLLAGSVRRCAANETPPGDLALPAWSTLRACDSGLREVAQWLAAHRVITEVEPFEAAGLQWDIYPLQTLATSYYFIVGTNATRINAPIDDSEAAAGSQLADLRALVTQKVAESGAATLRYVLDVGAQNINDTQAMQDSFLAEMRGLEASSLTALHSFEERAYTTGDAITALEANGVTALKQTHLDAMAVTAGWTLAVAFSILLAVLALSAWGTIRITNSLAVIIGLMEDVAHMRVEDLAVPSTSGVREVARIQAAFQVMVLRLAEYKSYIPAGVFEQLAQRAAEGEGPGVQTALLVEGSDNASDDSSIRDSTTATNSARQSSHAVPEKSKLGNRRSLSDSEADAALPRLPSSFPASASGGGVAARQVAALSINAVGFMDLLLAASDSMARHIFNEYVTHVHEAISQGRGNVDYLAGDQIFVTFNAHLPCSDPAGAATAAAVEVREQLLHRLGDRLCFHIGVSFGPVFASSVGYSKFKFMVTVGSPMKVAALLSRLDRVENGAILVDCSLKDRMKYSYRLRPVDLLYLPWLKSFATSVPKSHRVFLVLDKRPLAEGEWLYQVEAEDAAAEWADWAATFDQLVAAGSVPGAQALLQRYLAAQPEDEVALRLRDRLPRWVPGCGFPV